MEDLFFNVELPSTVPEMTIPVTLGCSQQFTINQQATGAAGEPYPIEFGAGDSVYLSIKSRGQMLQVDATINGSAASFVIPSSICDQVTNWSSTWVVIKAHNDGQQEPLAAGNWHRYDGGA